MHSFIIICLKNIANHFTVSNDDMCIIKSQYHLENEEMTKKYCLTCNKDVNGGFVSNNNEQNKIHNGTKFILKKYFPGVDFDRLLTILYDYDTKKKEILNKLKKNFMDTKDNKYAELYNKYIIKSGEYLYKLLDRIKKSKDINTVEILIDKIADFLDYNDEEGKNLKEYINNSYENSENLFNNPSSNNNPQDNETQKKIVLNSKEEFKSCFVTNYDTNKKIMICLVQTLLENGTSQPLLLIEEKTGN